MPLHAFHDRLLQDVLAQGEQLSRLWPGYRDPSNTESPHRQRTAINRLVGYALFLGLPTGPKAPPGHPFRVLKQWQRRVGVLRDLDVLQATLRDLVSGAAAPAAEPAMEAACAELASRRAAHLPAVRADAEGLPGARTRIALMEGLLLLREAIDAAPLPNPTAVLVPWHDALALLANDHEDATLHAFRVRNKRLRFVLEALAGGGFPAADALRSALKERARLVGRVHATLGELSDLRVVRTELRLLRAGWARAGKSIDASAAALEACRAAAEGAALERWFVLYPLLLAPDFDAPLQALPGVTP